MSVLQLTEERIYIFDVLYVNVEDKEYERIKSIEKRKLVRLTKNNICLKQIFIVAKFSAL